MFKPGLEACDVFLELFQKGQISRQFCQSWIRRDPRIIDGPAACCNQLSIKRIVLGAAQLHPTERFDLDWLQHQHSKTCRAQMRHHTTFIAASRLYPDARDASLDQACCQSAPAGQRVRDLPAFGSTVNRNVELGLRRIDSCRRYVNLRHLPRPCLVKRTKLFRQPSGSDEGADAITLRGSQKRLRADTIRSPAACRGLQSAAGHSSRNMPTITDRAITRAD